MEARSSPSRYSAPKGQPEPTIRSEIISRDLVSSKATLSMSIHSLLSHVKDLIPKSSVSDGNETGLISTPPIPASLSRCSSRIISLGSTLSPFHHQRTKGLYSEVGFWNKLYNSLALSSLSPTAFTILSAFPATSLILDSSATPNDSIRLLFKKVLLFISYIFFDVSRLSYSSLETALRFQTISPWMELSRYTNHIAQKIKLVGETASASPFKAL